MGKVATEATLQTLVKESTFLTQMGRVISAIEAFGQVSFDSVHTYVGDYVNDAVTLTTGSLDRYRRRIYGQ